MSEEWNGIKLAEVRTAYFRNLANTLNTVRHLIDYTSDVEYVFDTGRNGAVIVSNNYLNWEFIAPNRYAAPSGNTVGDLITSLQSSVTTNPVSAWDDFAVFLEENAAKINMFLPEGGSATIIDADGGTYTGTTHQVSSFNNFAECVSWMRSWFGSAALAASASVMFESSTRMKFSLSASGVTIQCSFQF